MPAASKIWLPGCLAAWLPGWPRLAWASRGWPRLASGASWLGLAGPRSSWWVCGRVDGRPNEHSHCQMCGRDVSMAGLAGSLKCPSGSPGSLLGLPTSEGSLAGDEIPSLWEARRLFRVCRRAMRCLNRPFACSTPVGLPDPASESVVFMAEAERE